MKNYKINISLIAVGLFLFSTACEDLETENLNNPPVAKVLSSEADLPGFLAGGYVSWWQANHQSRPGLSLGVASDVISCSWGNFGMRRMSWEPRTTYNNTTSESVDYKNVVNFPWVRNLSAQFTANAVLNALEGGTSDPMMEASAYFLRGVARGYLANTFDQGYLVELDTDLTAVEFSTYQEMLAGAVSDLSRVAAISEANTFTMLPSFISGLSLSQDQLGALANSYAARFIAHNARTEAENTATDWAAVRDFALKGITSNFAPQADGNLWFGFWQYAHIGNGGPTGSWARLDQRLVSAFDPSQPTIWTTDPGTATSADARLASDFTYVASQNFRPERGAWHFSHYKHSRNISEPAYVGDGTSSGPMPAFVIADNSLLLAEAYAMTGNLTGAAGVVNAGARVVRGGLTPVAATLSEILDAIHYERFIEILNTEPAGAFYDRRRLGRVAAGAVDAIGGLQEGTPGHLPVPAQELEVLELTPYNFGGPDNLGGI